MADKKTWRDTFHYITQAPEGTKRFEVFVPGFKHPNKMGPAMAYMYSAYDPVSDKWYRVTFATHADFPREEVDKTAENMMERKIRGHYQKILDRAMGIVC